MKIIAKVDFSTQLKKGDSYELPDSDAKILIAAGLAVPHVADAVADPSSRQTRSRTYARRDLQAAEVGS